MTVSVDGLSRDARRLEDESSRLLKGHYKGIQQHLQIPWHGGCFKVGEFKRIPGRSTKRRVARDGLLRLFLSLKGDHARNVSGIYP